MAGISVMKNFNPNFLQWSSRDVANGWRSPSCQRPGGHHRSSANTGLPDFRREGEGIWLRHRRRGSRPSDTQDVAFRRNGSRWCVSLRSALQTTHATKQSTPSLRILHWNRPHSEFLHGQETQFQLTCRSISELLYHDHPTYTCTVFMSSLFHFLCIRIQTQYFPFVQV